MLPAAFSGVQGAALASVLHPGLLRTLSGNSAQYMDGSGNWSVPPGTNIVSPSVADNFVSFSNITGSQKDSGVGAATFPILAPGASNRNVLQPTGAGFTPLVVKGFAGQTATLLEAQDSAAAILFSVSSAGNITNAGASDAASTRFRLLTKTYTGAAVTLGGGVTRGLITYTPPGSAGATQMVAYNQIITKTGTQTLNDPSAYLIALQGQGLADSTATSGTITKLVGTAGLVNNTASGGTVTHGIALLASLGGAAGAIFTNLYGMVVSPSAAGLGQVTINASATITNVYGIYIEDLTIGTNKYAIWTTGTAAVRFGGTLQVGTHSTLGSSLLGAAVPADAVLSVQENFLPSAGVDKWSIIATVTANAAFAAGGLFAGAYESVYSGSGTAFQVIGLSGGAFIETGTSGTITTAFGVKSFIRIKGTGTVTTGYGLMAQLLADTSGAVFTDGRNIGILAPQLAAGTTITTLYGLKVEAMTGTGITTGYAIHTSTGLVHFGDSLDLASGKNITLIAGNIITDTTTGTIIGSVGGAAGQKLGFFGHAPVVQPLLATGAGRLPDDIITVLQTLGLVRQS